MSTESIASPADTAVESCAACGAPLAEDQRYCLECGERRFPMSSVLLGGPGGTAGTAGASGAGRASGSESYGGGALFTPAGAFPPAAPPGYGVSGAADAGRRGNAVTVIAGVGVLLLAMGVGVLIGRSSASSRQSGTPTQVISVSQPASTGAAGAETTPSASETTAKSGSASGAKGASKSGSDGAGKSNSSGSSSTKGVGASESHPAPPSVVQSLNKKHGKSYEQESKNLPNVVSTG